MSVWTGFVLSLAALAQAAPLERLGRLDHPAIREASGIVASRRHAGIFWVHNDSGNPPELYAVRRDGSLVREFAVKATNLDWEDIAVDDEGHLYLGDIGNNGAFLPVRTIYQLDEPDPEKDSQAPLPVRLAWSYRMARGERFDTESLFVDRGQAVLVAKSFDGRDAELFAVPLDPAAAAKPAGPKRLGSLPGFREPATGADLSRDGQLLAVCTYNVARVYERKESGPWALAGTVRFPPGAVEGIGWDGLDLVLVSEARDVYRIAEAVWRKGGEKERGLRPGLE